MAAQTARIALIGFLDTKLNEYAYVSDLLERAGCQVLMIDVSTKEVSTSSVPHHWTTFHGVSDVYEAGKGSSPNSPPTFGPAANSLSREKLTSIMRSGALSLLREVKSSSQGLHGLCSIGGSQSTSLGSWIMRAPTFPIGLPKLCVTTMMSGDVGSYVGESDIVCMPSIVDISNRLNAISARVLSNASAALSGMAHAYAASSKHPVADPAHTSEDTAAQTSARPLVAISMFGLTTPCVTAASKILEQRGFEPVVFHASGLGGKSMERLIREGWFAGVLDLTTTELADELLGGILSAGPMRLTASASCNVPQIVSVGALDMANFGAPSSVPTHYLEAKDPPRTFHHHNDQITLLRTAPSECAQLGSALASKILEGRASVRERGTGPKIEQGQERQQEQEQEQPQTLAPCEIWFPLGGLSGIDCPGGSFEDIQARQELLKAIKEGVRPDHEAKVVEREEHINDEAFAQAVAHRMADLLQGWKKS